MKNNNEALRSLSKISTYLVDENIGIIRFVKELPIEPGNPNFFHFYARACDTGAFCEQKNSADAGGASVDRGTALAKALGEATERYCSAIYQRNDFPLCSYEDAQFPCVEPEKFSLFSSEQFRDKTFPYVPFQKKTIARWTPALDLVNRQVVHVPTASVFVPYYYDKENNEFPILQPISTGLACHSNPLLASISAICEVIERDAFTITWQARMSPQHIALETLSEVNRDLVARFEAIGANVTLLNLSSDHGVPVILSVLSSKPTDAPALVFANSCSLDPEIAVRKSLEELAHGYKFCRQLKNAVPRFSPTRGFSNVGDRDSHVALYCDHANAHLANFIFESNEHISFSDINNDVTGSLTQDLATLGERIDMINHRVLLVDVTTEDIRSLGLSVIRAVVPGLHPFVIGHSIRALGGTRLWELPQKLGYKNVPRKRIINSPPHPLP